MRQPGHFSRRGEQYLTLNEAANAMRVPRWELTEAVTQGALNVQRINGCKAFSVADLLDYIDAQAKRKKAGVAV